RKQRRQNEAKHHAELLGRDRKDEIGVTFREHALDRAFARSAAEPAAANKGFRGDIDVESVARRRIEEAVDALRDVRDGEESRDQTRTGRARQSDYPDQPHASDIKQRPPDQRDQHGLAEIGLQHQERDNHDKQRECDRIRRHFRSLRAFREQPGDENDERGLEEFRGLDIHSENDEPTPGALDLAAEVRRQRGQNQAYRENDERHFADFARGKERGRDQDQRRGDKEQDLAVYEMK